MYARGEGYCPSSGSSALHSVCCQQHGSEHRCRAVPGTAQPPHSEPAARSLLCCGWWACRPHWHRHLPSTGHSDAPAVYAGRDASL